MKHLPRGFTLVELLVSITIIAVIAAIGLTVYSSAQRSARDARRKADLQAISRALQLYYFTYKRYPLPRPSSGVVSNDPATSPCGWGNRSSSPNAPSCGGDQWLTADVNFPQFLPIVPRDPINNRAQATYAEDNAFAYTYWSDTDGTTFDLLTKLENADDAEACKNVGYWIETMGGQGTKKSWCINWCAAKGITGCTSWYLSVSADWLYVVNPQVTQ